jgi:A/G-specific adenine glycosylase
MRTEQTGCALALRSGASETEVLLEQRPASETVMPGMWQLPVLLGGDSGETVMTVRHAIMQVNYLVRVRSVRPDEVAGLTAIRGARRWVPLGELAGLALNGLARKVLMQARLLAPRTAG